VATSPLLQIDSSTVDAAGVSVVTATPSSTNVRQGVIYDSSVMAAAAPIWFHPLSIPGQFLMINARRWSAATPGGGPGVYSAYTEDLTPTWRLLDVAGGHATNPVGQPMAIPLNTVATNVAVVAAASRPPNILFLLYSATVNGTAAAILQRLHVNTTGSVTIANEEVLPGVEGVVFNRGLQYDTPNLVVYGTDANHKVYRITKLWAHVGINSVRTVVPNKYTTPSAVGAPTGWQYYTGTGYSSDPTELAPVTVYGGYPLTTYGPMSFAQYRNQVLMTTVALNGTTYTGQRWAIRSGLPAVALGSPIALGSSADGSYLGGGVQLMSQLAPNPVATGMTDSGVVSGIPYLTTQRTSPAGGHSLNVVWNLWLTVG
jgi:hypothetical protein